MAMIPTTAILLVLSTTVLSMGSLVGIAAANAVKPQISTLPEASIPRGCGYSLDDWRRSTLAWAPYPYASKPQAKGLLMAIDGVVREIPISSRDERHITAHDGRYEVDIWTPQWKRVDTELFQARATLLLRDTTAHTATNIIVRAAQGC
ncbi:hypothetical protein [Cyanobium gracile]|uniref:Uncharacterized protein n=1 Tax=Cyanobium gracile UHCC 0281 TaxID=3110309 RepID=A0ABU5T091_9CYAN|nr:hypothetical protein [Cyanobium gracile]MEA5444187.1 hypothetical protein [Cyanobium gracile UHCC 0281]